MTKSLLLGNGINARIGITELSVKDIGKRFYYNIGVYSPVIEKVFDVITNKDFMEYIEKNCMNCGIETLAGYLYKYVRENKKNKWTDNDEYRIQDVISCICLSSIFFTNNGKIKGNYDETKMFSVEKYNNVFTLNYVEFWDVQNKSIYLHGRVDISKLSDVKNGILVSKNRMLLREYRESINGMGNSIIEFVPNDIIFAPEGIEKNRLVCVRGIFPSNQLYPADDLFLYRPKILYTELDKADEIDVFGMSPYGDKSIIDVLNCKKKVRVFIYNKDQNKETDDWADLLKCPHELLDSADI